MKASTRGWAATVGAAVLLVAWTARAQRAPEAEQHDADSAAAVQQRTATREHAEQHDADSAAAVQQRTATHEHAEHDAAAAAAVEQGAASPEQAGDIEALAAAAVEQGAVAPEQAEAFREQLRRRLRARMGEVSACAGTQAASCRERLQAQARACLRIAARSGTEGERVAGAMAAMMMLASQDRGRLKEAGELVQRQLRGGWTADDMERAAAALGRIPSGQRWREPAVRMLSECTSEKSCSGEQATLAVQVMAQASHRADLDPRRSRRAVESMLREQKRSGTAEMDAQHLRARLRARLRIRAHDGSESLAGNSEQKRYTYRHGVESESRRGGDFGGSESSGPGRGMEPGAFPASGPGGGKGR